MNVAIAGAHGQIALRLARLLAAEGDRVIGLIRNPDHAIEVSRAGASPVLCDLERASVEEIATAIEGADAVVFAAGAGPGSGADRKLTMDRDGAIKLLRAATTPDAPRYLMISGAGVEDPPGGDEVFEVYLRAKRRPMRRWRRAIGSGRSLGRAARSGSAWGLPRRCQSQGSWHHAHRRDVGRVSAT